MNTFVKLIKLSEFSYEKVRYYSVVINDKEYKEENSEFYCFLSNMELESESETDLVNLITWIEEIGEKYGAKEKFFRKEGIYSDTSALPPDAGEQRVCKILVNNLRLYCLRANEHVVILFNGGIKTTIKANDCPNVKNHFLTANRITKKINESFKTEITWNSDYTDICFNESFEFEI